MISSELDAQPPNATHSATIPKIHMYRSPRAGISKRNRGSKATANALKQAPTRCFLHLGLSRPVRYSARLGRAGMEQEEGSHLSREPRAYGSACSAFRGKS